MGYTARTALPALLAAACLTPAAAAELEPRLEGGAYYDSVLGVTWLADANLGAGSAFDDGNDSDGRMQWQNAVDWAAALSVGGITGWRLASMDVDGDGEVVDCSVSSATLCRDNEYGHLFHQQGIDSLNSGPFENVGTARYWSGTEAESDAWLFDFTFGSGNQITASRNTNLLAWAVYDGDVAPVPVPAALWMLAPVVTCLLALSGRRAPRRTSAAGPSPSA